eukprot:TRINITY_DN10998_c1_g2_i2.p1 TRINITY_DN10998_c1_g2~~TRINITY_DN10998_c1_g2_i2.p1  ORF type:complete len:429 (-),score=95.00 TRINITY_DN10998_c1_g2_i2:141-1394(-)
MSSTSSATTSAGATAVGVAAVASSMRSSRMKTLRRGLTVVAGAAAAAGLAAYAYNRYQRHLRDRRIDEHLERWCKRGPAKEPVIDCEVPVEHGIQGETPDFDVVEVPVGLAFECERIRGALLEKLGASDEAELVEVLQTHFDVAASKAAAANDTGADDLIIFDSEVQLSLPWIDLAALAQLTYWYDRRPGNDDQEADSCTAVVAAITEERERLSDAKFGRWTKKVSREQVVYGSVALRYRTRASGHIGQKVFRRPAGVDVTRIGTLQRAASLTGHGLLLDLVEETMESLRPKNVAKIPFSEVARHSTKDDLWLLIDGKVYDVTPFLNLHPGGGQLIVEAAAQDATSLFEQTHGEGLRYSLRLMNQFFIGDCSDPQEAKKASAEPPTPEFLTTLRSITGALHTFDEAKATGEAQGILK